MRDRSAKFLGLMLMAAWAASCGPSLEYSAVKTGPAAITPDETAPPDESGESPARTHGDLQIVMVDVGQGDGLVVISPNGKTVVIDTGIKEAGQTMVDFLTERGVTTVDLMILTHPHADHIGGATTVINSLEVLRVLDSGSTHESATYRKLFETLDERGIPVLIAHRGRKIKLDQGIEMTVLAPFDEPFTGTRSDANSNSIVARLTYGKVSVLFTGDSEAVTEEALIEHKSPQLPLSATVLKVAHHGSAYASTQAFLEEVNPKAALISCGAGNSYGHPNSDTVDRISSFTPYVYRTDEQGTISLITDGTTLTITPARGAPATISVN